MKKFKQIFDTEFLGGSKYAKNVVKSGAKFVEKKVFKFTWDYCSTCRTMFVRCPKCGNNCCNAGFGEVTKKGLPKENLGDKGVTCDVCNLAYQFQDLAWKTKESPPEPTKKEKAKLVSAEDKLLKKIFGY